MLYPIKINETFSDYPTPDDIAVIVYFQGCEHNCKNCQNKELQICEDKNAKTLEETYNLILNYCKRAATDKIVLSGGDPFYNKNKEQLKDMLSLISILESSNFQVCVYTGYSIEDIKRLYKEYSSFIKPTYVKCGVYIEELRDPNMGKNDDSFILATKNQAFFKKINNKFSQISQSNVLFFN